jgi:hypothetical protein
MELAEIFFLRNMSIPRKERYTLFLGETPPFPPPKKTASAAKPILACLYKTLTMGARRSCGKSPQLTSCERTWRPSWTAPPFPRNEFNKDKNSSGKELVSENDVKRRLWKEYSATKEDKSAAKKLEEDTAAYVRIANARSLSGTIPSGNLTSGFEMTLTSCADNKIGGTVVILQKNERGEDAISRKKTRDKIVQALKPEISAGNISRIFTSTDADE